MNLQKELKHQEGFVCGEGLANIPAEKIVSNIKRRVAWANMLGAFGAGMRQTTTTVNSNATVFDNRGGMVTGTGTATITAPDKQVQAALLH